MLFRAINFFTTFYRALLLSTNPTKWSNTLQAIRWQTNCLSVFDYVIGLALKGLKKIFYNQLRAPQ